jgi:hypothetical protein
MKGSGILQALLTMDAVALAAMLAAAWAAGRPPEGATDALPRHLAWGLGAVLLGFVARCVAIFYMLAAGRALKDLVADEGLDPSFVARQKRLKRPVETLATLALVPALGAAFSGGGAATAGAGASHGAWAWAAVGAAAACLLADAWAGPRNHRLLRDADAWLRGRGGGGAGPRAG